ncbi:hypothetical protein PMW_75 [Pseudomonas phage phiPMW]|uniref:Uncharacterized protein n=1 Tax=Pseudomonas phage phiPMW TaxID=1815582 RepID=A0A1S5R1B5_9CAUD|nr:hypothetical protein FDG97_gp075 [Pseudomonas phage phiPMW]ANA49200.1 hypothetical protein PMW_75 [Pseudomonas phage phiPMW]
MWIVTVMEPHYPSIFEFDDYWLALEKYNELARETGEEYHIESDQYKVHLSSVIKKAGSYYKDEQDWT